MGNTGNIIITERDMNPLSPTYNNTREITQQDLVHCPTAEYKLWYKWTDFHGEYERTKGCNGDPVLTDTETSNTTQPRTEYEEAKVGTCVTEIGERAFYNASKMDYVYLPDTITSIGYQAFRGCTQLQNPTPFYKSQLFPPYLVSIGGSAFSDCDAIVNITLPDNLTDIGGYAFSYCDSLRRFSVSASVTSIGTNLLRGCGDLMYITVDSNNTIYDSRDDCNAIIETATNTLIEGCKNTVIPNTVTKIGSCAFAERNYLTSMAIPSGVTEIGDHAFYSCYRLSTLTIPSTVTEIGEDAITQLSNARSITCEATTPPTLGMGNLFLTNDCPIYVPAASVSAYKSANRWSNYASRIQAIPT